MFPADKKKYLTLFILFFASLSIAPPTDFIHVEDGQLLLGDSDEPIFLRGMGFGNFVYDRIDHPDTLFMHHDQAEFQRLADAGMNSIRFYLSYSMFEDDQTPFTYNEATFDWFETNLQWAAETGIYLTPVMMRVAGQHPSSADASDFWDSDLNKARFIALWMEIATRFADESVLGGYDLINEPITTESGEQ